MAEQEYFKKALAGFAFDTAAGMQSAIWRILVLRLRRLQKSLITL